MQNIEREGVEVYIYTHKIAIFFNLSLEFFCFSSSCKKTWVVYNIKDRKLSRLSSPPLQSKRGVCGFFAKLRFIHMRIIGRFFNFFFGKKPCRQWTKKEVGKKVQGHKQYMRVYHKPLFSNPGLAGQCPPRPSNNRI